MFLRNVRIEHLKLQNSKSASTQPQNLTCKILNEALGP